MFAAFYTRTGRARDVLTLGEFQTPDPGPHEVRVRIAQSGINPADVKRRAGELGRDKVFPVVIPHSDGHGWIDAVGAGVADRRPGDAVWLWNAQWKRPFGTAAEYAILPASQTVAIPTGLPQERRSLCAALGVPGLTAHRSVSALGEVAGKSVLIQGGGGMVGQFAIQFLKRRGARVLAGVSDDARAQVALAAGADAAIRYTDADHLDQFRAESGPGGFDCVIAMNFGANCADYCRYVTKHGEVVVVGSVADMFPKVPVLPFQVHGLTVRFISGSEQPEAFRARAIDEITSGLAEGWLGGRIHRTFALQDIALAHEEVERGGLTGKVVVTIAA
ncbi:MAG: NADPH:quinone reductase [Rhodobacteraceae bacterium]|jgi:NADPH2:quinone reductase|nr:NADPH:quinone reductase [Paracoccaceae bacterium]